MYLRHNRLVVAVSLGLALLLASPALSQFEASDFQLAPGLSKFNTGPPDSNLKVQAQVRMAPGEKIGVLEVTATMDKGWHVYSLTQPSGGPMKSAVKLAPSDQYRLLGSFAPDRPPYVHFVDVFEMDVEEFSERVTWSALIELTGASAGNLAIGGYIEGQVCADEGACIPFGEEKTQFNATVVGQLTADETKTLTGTRLKGTHAQIRSWLSSDEVTPGDTVYMHIAFDPDPNWHVYAYEKLPPSMFQKPTLVHAVLPEGWIAGDAKSSSPIVSEEGLPNDPPIRYYRDAATISVPIKVPQEARAGLYPLSGRIAYQTCSKQCDPPTAIAWTSQLKVSSSIGGSVTFGAVAFDPKPSDYDSVAKALEQASGSRAGTGGGGVPAGSAATGSGPNAAVSVTDLEFAADEEKEPPKLTGVLGAAFIGGFVLNFMPCVLPVIGLKILSFVEQAGSNRFKAFSLNAWYSLGMLSIFWVLAVLAAAPALGLSQTGLGWGEHFNYQGFAIPLVAVVFVMALSFLGVWEIPIPGFATGAKASELSEKEGYSGAFFKGAITTVLATPCGAPGLVTAYAFAVKSGSPTLPFLIFTVMGLGMAIPYLLIGAFPSLLRFLPKPGAWMDTFKQLMGFVLLGTVIFLMQNVTFQNMLPTIALLFGLWFACWWIGRVPLTAAKDQRLRAWGVAMVIGILATVISFGRHVDAFGMTFSGLLGHAEQKYNFGIDRAISQRGGATSQKPVVVSHSANSLPWETFSTALLDEIIGDGHTVLVDFTADW